MGSNINYLCSQIKERRIGRSYTQNISQKFSWKIRRKRSFGWPRCRRKDNILTDLKEDAKLWNVFNWSSLFGDDISENSTISIYMHHNADSLHSQRSLNPSCHLPSPGFMFRQKQKISWLTKELQGEHKVFPWLQTIITRKLRGIQTYFF